MRRSTFCLLALTTASISLSAQSTSIRGRVTDLEGEPIPGVAVRLVGSNIATVTDAKGFYHLKGIAGKEVHLAFSCMGFEPLEREVYLDPRPGRDGKPHQHIDVVLKEAVQSLQTVEIVGRSESSYRNSGSFSGTKTASLLKDIPSSIGYVTKELALDQGALSLNDVVKNVSGVSQYSHYNDFSIRGFRVQGNRSSGMLVNGMRAQSSMWKPQSLLNVERVEVIKGPASALFGNASPGGVINRVTKKPLPNAQHSVTTSIGSWNSLAVQGDFTGSLSKDKKVLYRLNLGYDSSDTFRELQHTDNIVVAPSFSYLPNSKTQLNIDIVFQNTEGKLDRALAIFDKANFGKVPISQTFSATDDYLRERFLHITGSFTQEFSSNLKLNAIYMRSSYDESLLEHQPLGYLSKPDGSQDPTQVSMMVRQRERSFRNNSLNLFLSHSAQWGRIRNNLLLGYDYFQMDLLPGASEWNANSYLLRNGKSSNRVSARTGVIDTEGNYTLNVPTARLTQGRYYGRIEGIPARSKDYIWADQSSTYLRPYRQYSHAAYVQDQIELYGFKLLMGLRKEWFTDVLYKGYPDETKVSQSSLIPRIGLVYSLSKDANLYATWMRGYEVQNATVQTNPAAGGPFDPMESELFEVGSKVDLFGRRLSLTASLFHLTQRGSLYRSPDATQPDLRVQIGQERSQGLELDLIGYISRGWSVNVAYAYTDAIVKRSVSPDLEGMQLPSTPKHQGSVWTKYVFTSGALKGFGVGVGVNAQTERNSQLDRNDPLVLPGYMLTNAALYYKTGKAQVQINLNNIFDKEYYTGGYNVMRIFPGAPRSVKATFSYRW